MAIADPRQSPNWGSLTPLMQKAQLDKYNASLATPPAVTPLPAPRPAPLPGARTLPVSPAAIAPLLPQGGSTIGVSAPLSTGAGPIWLGQQGTHPPPGWGLPGTPEYDEWKRNLGAPPAPVGPVTYGNLLPSRTNPLVPLGDPSMGPGVPPANRAQPAATPRLGSPAPTVSPLAARSAAAAQFPAVPGQWETGAAQTLSAQPAQASPTSILAKLLGSILSNDVRYSPSFTGALNRGLRPSASDATLRDISMMGPDQTNNLASLFGPNAFASWLWSLGLLSPLGMRTRGNVQGGVRV